MLVFRKTRARDGSGALELGRGQMLSQLEEMQGAEEWRDVSLVYIADRTKRAPSGPSFRRLIGESREQESLVVPRWLKKVLLMVTFTAWTAAAIAISLALA